MTFGGLPLTVGGLSLSMTRETFEAGNWVLRLNEGDDGIEGTNYADVIHAGKGNDIVHGYDGSDVITGFDGNDTLDGGTGNDGLFGGTGSDVLSGGIGHNHLDGGSGWDFALLDGSRDDYTFARQDDGSVIAQNGTGSIVDTLREHRGLPVLRRQRHRFHDPLPRHDAHASGPGAHAGRSGARAAAPETRRRRQAAVPRRLPPR